MRPILGMLLARVGLGLIALTLLIAVRPADGMAFGAAWKNSASAIVKIQSGQTPRIPEAALQADYQQCVNKCGPGSSCQSYCGCILERLRAMSPVEYLKLEERIRRDQISDADGTMILECRVKAAR